MSKDSDKRRRGTSPCDFLLIYGKIAAAPAIIIGLITLGDLLGKDGFSPKRLVIIIVCVLVIAALLLVEKYEDSIRKHFDKAQCDAADAKASNSPMPDKHVSRASEEPSLAGNAIPVSEEPKPAGNVVPVSEEPSPAGNAIPVSEEPSSAGNVIPVSEKPKPAGNVAPVSEEPKPARHAVPVSERSDRIESVGTKWQIGWVSGILDDIGLVYEKAEEDESIAQSLARLESLALDEARQYCDMFSASTERLTSETFDGLSAADKEAVIVLLGEKGLQAKNTDVANREIVVTLSPVFQSILGCTMFKLLNWVEKLDGALNEMVDGKVTLTFQVPLGGRKGLVQWEMLIMRLYPWLGIREISSSFIAVPLSDVKKDADAVENTAQPSSSAQSFNSQGMSHSNSSPKQNEDQRVLFTTVAGSEGDVADCVLRYSQMEAGAAHIFAGKQSSLAACNIPHASLASFCKELAQLGASIYLELKNPYHQRMFVYKDMRIDAAYLFDPCADVFYRPDKEKGIVRVTQSEMSLCYYIVEPDTLCLFGSGVFSSFEHYLPKNSGYPEYPWEQTGHEWDFYTTILRFSASIDMKHLWSPRHSVEIIDWLSKPFLEAVAPVDNARAPLPSTEEILRRLHAPSTTQEKKAEVKTGEKSSVPHAQAMKMVETQKKSGKSNARNAVQIIADRLKDDMFVIPVETLFCLGGFGYTLNNQNCVFYHLASVQEDKAWMNMKSKWRKDLFNCVVMTNQSDDWARKVSKRLNKQLHDRRIIFLRPVKIDGSVDLSALDPEQPKVIARWYAPLEKKYYQCVIKWDGYSHDGSEDYYSLMLYAAE